ncbi:hypothetical protein GCK72_020449 [Caenorhabditis remanei]|uniref:Seven TM Receptor n=1 Tax=Caenorhabditis remanei TaxID=31234 RepID=A0A6A5GHA7_CAERE|nr:hypothetical protein GCK72_020449 [Caenorhabditis remanei]KAF1753892.1 hypothetical protein GCK72_020449 [Caenorhabditis remanei]
MSSTLSNITHILGWFSFFTAIWATITLFILIEKKSPKEFGGYKNFLRIYCFYAFAFSIIDWLNQPAIVIDIHGFGYAFYSENRLFDLGYTGGLSVQNMSQFASEYIAVRDIIQMFLFRPYYIIFFQGWRVILLFLYCALPFFIWSMLVYTLMAPVPDRTAHLNVTTMLIENVDLVNKAYVGVLCRHVTNSTEHSYGDIEWGTMSTLLGLFGFQSFFYTVSLVCGVLTYKDTMKLFKMAQMSKELYKMQMQLLKAIVLQASIPLILVYIPPAIMIVGGMCGTYVGQIGYFVVMSISIYPPLDSLVFLLSIRCYRSALCCHGGSVGSTGATSVVPFKVLASDRDGEYMTDDEA